MKARFDNQGKKPSQVKYSYDVTHYIGWLFFIGLGVYGLIEWIW